MTSASSKLLSETEVTEALSQLPNWRYQAPRLHREYVFADFLAALNWMHELAPEIDRQDHHPVWSNVYNRVQVELWSHDVGGITRRDLRLASTLELAFAKRQAT